MAWAMASAGKFSHPVADRRLIQSTFDYAYHFDASLYAAFLRKYAEARGVTRVEGRVVDVALDPESGAILGDRKSTRLNSSTNAHLVCRLLLEKKNKKRRK